MTDERDEVVRRLAVADDCAAYKETGNPLHVWCAIGGYAADEPLPLWVRRYLLKITRDLWRLALDLDVSPAAAQKEMLQALGFGGEQGRNVVSRGPTAAGGQFSGCVVRPGRAGAEPSRRVGQPAIRPGHPYAQFQKADYPRP